MVQRLLRLRDLLTWMGSLLLLPRDLLMLIVLLSK
jgi:hypothetical protein